MSVELSAACYQAPFVHLFSLNPDKDQNQDQTEGFRSAKLDIDPASLLQPPRQTDKCWIWSSLGFKVAEDTDHRIFPRKMRVSTFSSGFAIQLGEKEGEEGKEKKKKEKVLC